MAQKKIIHIVEAMGGGVFTYIVDLANTLCETMDVYVAYGIRDETPENFSDYFDKRVKLIRVKNFVREIRPVSDIKSAREIRKMLDEIQPDIIHLHSSKAGVIGRVFVSSKKFPEKYYTPHGYSFLMRDVSKIKRYIYYVLEKWCGPYKCVTIACGEGEYLETKKVTSQAIKINNGINIEELKGQIKEQIRDVNVVKGDKFKIMTSGRICAQKNPKLFNKIAQMLPDIQFVWVGDGELRDELTSSNIEITGWCERKKALEHILSGDAFILTSLWEGLSISLLEAMYLQRVCIVSNVIGNRDVIINDLNGYVCDTVDDFVNAILEVKGSENKNARLTAKAFRDLGNHYTTQHIGQKYIKVYNHEPLE